MRISYKNYGLESSSYQLQESKKWKARINIIARDKNGKMPIHPFTDHNKLFNTKEEADAYALTFGKELIDGNSLAIKPSA